MLLWLAGLFTVSGTVAYTLSGPLVFRVVTEPEERKPDERQRAVNYRAGYLAWIITAFLIVLVYVYWLLGAIVGVAFVTIPQPEVLLFLFGGFIALVGSLHSAITAWAEPDAEE